MIAALLLSSPSFADNLRFCVTIDVDYVDIDDTEPAPVRWRTDVDRPARFVDYTVLKSTSTPFGPVLTVISSGNLDENGCTPSLALASSTLYRVDVTSEAWVPDQLGAGLLNFVRVEDVVGGDPAEASWEYLTPSAFAGTKTFAALPGSTDARWNIAAVAVTALWLNPGGLTDKNFFLYTNEACDPPGDSTSKSCVDEAAESVYYTESVISRYEVAKRLGQLVAAYVDEGGNGCSETHDLSPDSCLGDLAYSEPGLITKAYYTEAACEAIGRYYAAVTWNPLTSSAQSPCWYRWNAPLNWDLSGNVPDWDNYRPFVCRGDPWNSALGKADPDDEDWLEDMDDQTSTSCGDLEPISNSTTSYDFLRYFWTMVSDQGVTKPEIWELWDEADPHAWSHPQAPLGALEDASIDVGIYTAHEAAIHHVDHSP